MMTFEVGIPLELQSATAIAENLRAIGIRSFTLTPNGTDQRSMYKWQINSKSIDEAPYCHRHGVYVQQAMANIAKSLISTGACTVEKKTGAIERGVYVQMQGRSMEKTLTRAKVFIKPQLTMQGRGLQLRDSLERERVCSWPTHPTVPSFCTVLYIMGPSAPTSV